MNTHFFSRRQITKLDFLTTALLTTAFLLALSSCSDKVQPVLAPTITPANVTTSALPLSSPLSTVITTKSLTNIAEKTVTPKSETTTIQTIDQTFRKRWLQKIPCELPCWEGITPRKTSLEEAKTILSQIPLVENLGKPYISGYLLWFWSPNTNKPNDSEFSKEGAVKYVNTASGAVVSSLDIGQSGVVFADVIKVFGEPSHVIATFERMFETEEHKSYYYIYTLELRYLNKGINLKIKGLRSAPIIDSNLVIQSLELSLPGEENVPKVVGYLGKELLVPWEGFKDWKYYCRYYFDYPTTIIVKDCSNIPNL